MIITIKIKTLLSLSNGTLEYSKAIKDRFKYPDYLFVEILIKHLTNDTQ